MKKETILLIAAAVLVLCVAAAIILFQLAANRPSGNADPVEVLRSELKELLLEADSMFCSGEVVTVNRNQYTDQYVVYWQYSYKKILSGCVLDYRYSLYHRYRKA